MKIGASAAASREVEETLSQIIPKAKKPLGNETADLALFFVTPHFSKDLPCMAETIREETQADTLIGCTAEGVLGPEGEFERIPAASLWLAHLPDVKIQAYYLNQPALEACREKSHWLDLFQIQDAEKTRMIFLGDPLSIKPTILLEGLNQYLPGLSVMGGMASGINPNGDNHIIFDKEIYTSGAACVVMEHSPAVQSVVSQGCRPIGSPYMVTQAEKNVIQKLSTHPPLHVLNEIYKQSDPQDQILINKGVFLGRVINEYQKEFTRGDFLIRNLLGADQETGSIAVMDIIPVGTTVQFHIRDADTSTEDLKTLLRPYQSNKPAGVLLFNCNGRGTRLYTEPNQDSSTIQTMLHHPSMSGFFCAGELGPVGHKNFIHGHTASLAIFNG